jgi:hypothetical protein
MIPRCSGEAKWQHCLNISIGGNERHGAEDAVSYMNVLVESLQILMRR